MTRPRLLFISPRFLFPLDEGGKIRTANILRHLKGGAFDILLASPAPDGHAFADELSALCDHFVSWPRPPVAPWRRVAALASRLPVGVATDRSEAGRAIIGQRMAAWRPDVVVADFVHGAVLHPDRKQAASVLFTHNVEAEIFERHAQYARGPRRVVWMDQARKMRRFEGETVRAYDRVVAVSARDAEALQTRYGVTGVARIDTGVDLDYFTMQPVPVRDRADTVVFTGVMDSPANSDGITYLMNDIWPIILRGRPDARALIVGRNPPVSLVAAARDWKLAWEFTGSVPDIRPHVAAADIAVIPLRIGSGTRIKAFEAMAMGRPVVSTSVGIEGLTIEPGRHFLLADNADAFAASVLRLLGDATLRADMRATAWAHLDAHFSWEPVGRQFEEICLAATRKEGSASF